jgi:alkylation response protein AidB-like acyl-CoA dehydrogenase
MKSDLFSVAPLPGFPPNTSPLSEIQPVEITASGTANFPFTAGEITNHFRLAKRFPTTYFTMLEEVRGRAREFADKYIRPRAVDLDKKISHDPTYFDWDLVRKACPYRFFSMLIPTEFEGMGCYSLHMAAMVEELAVGCGGTASTIGVHSAGVSCGMISLDPYILEKYLRPTAQAEIRGEPILWGGAVTEPAAGTDIWDEDFLEKARVVTFAKKVPGGYVLNGRKCFISNGNVAKYIVVAAALDPKHIRESWSAFLVPSDTKGFSVGRIERKMGQKSSPAAELIFEDMFLPDELLIGKQGMGARAVTVYLAGSRGPVGAIGTGIARRALECLIDWAKQKKTGRGRLIDQQAIQLIIARMSKEVEEARAAYVAAGLACDEMFLNIMGNPLVKIMLGAVPHKLFLNPSVVKIAKSDFSKNIMIRILLAAVAEDRLAQTSALATIAKIKGSSVGVNVSGEVARIMGPDSADPRWPVEKCWRDAKLTQIYEGTNQANAITLFKDTVRRWR